MENVPASAAMLTPPLAFPLTALTIPPVILNFPVLQIPWLEALLPAVPAVTVSVPPLIVVDFVT